MALDSVAQEAPKEHFGSLEDRVPNEGPPDANRAVTEAPLEIAVELPFSARLTNAAPHKLKGPDRLVLNSPIILMKWYQPSSVAPVPGADTG